MTVKKETLKAIAEMARPQENIGSDDESDLEGDFFSRKYEAPA